MSSNRRTDTSFELSMRSELHRRGLRFRKDLPIRAGALRARPDVVFTRALVVVMLDGCFWHGCSEHRSVPTRNARFWQQKIEQTIERDRRIDKALAAAGWSVIHVWEHEPIPDAAARIEVVVRRALSARRG
jgi:DNA mismatch endonuclease (patch repair protein)